MDIEELRQRRKKIKKNIDILNSNIDKIINETKRVESIAANSEKIIADLDKEFENLTGLNKVDFPFLFLATALQCIRIYLINNLTKIDKAGNKNKTENTLHKVQKRVLKKFDNGNRDEPSKFYAPLNQIIFNRGVPYDAQNFLDTKYNLFKGANHRFSTLGHDPILGLIFGTANILTNTITCNDKFLITTNHVVYDSAQKNPKIANFTSTILMLDNAINRFNDDIESFVAALIKQILHIGTDLYTPCGIHIPFSNLLLDKKNVEELAKVVNTGDIIKLGMSMKISLWINTLISLLHQLMYDEKIYKNRDIYNVKTKKIIMYSNAIASTSNIIWVAINLKGGNQKVLKQLDIGGLMVTIYRLITDIDFVIKIKEEFVLGGFRKMIIGEEIDLQEV